MKTSNIIIISYCVLVVAGMLTLFIDSKQHTKMTTSGYEFELKESGLSTFNVIVADKDADVHIDQADSNKIGIEYPNGVEVPKRLYSLSNDTLFIYGTFRTWVKCRNINRIISHNHNWLGINYSTTDSLLLSLNGGRTFIRNKENRIKINCLQINASEQSYVELNNLITNSMDLNCENKSKIRIFSKSNKVNARIGTYSELYLSNNPKELSVEKDSTSIFTCNK